MDALIIAAGFGSRLSQVSQSKPMTPIGGVPLIEIAIRQLIRAGVTRVVVVTGHEAERVEGFLATLAPALGIAIEPVRLTEWSSPNGHSVLAGAARCPGSYLLVMADHIFEVAILSRLVANAAPDQGITLAIDRRLDNPLIDPDDATFVRTDAHGQIKAIGKTITPYDAVDCGAFLASPELAVAIRAAIAAGRPGSLSDGVQILADYNRAATMDIGDGWWIDVDEPEMHRLAEEQAPAHLDLRPTST